MSRAILENSLALATEAASRGLDDGRVNSFPGKMTLGISIRNLALAASKFQSEFRAPFSVKVLEQRRFLKSGDIIEGLPRHKHHPSSPGGDTMASPSRSLECRRKNSLQFDRNGRAAIRRCQQHSRDAHRIFRGYSRAAPLHVAIRPLGTYAFHCEKTRKNCAQIYLRA
jgi:hypothetical protein